MGQHNNASQERTLFRGKRNILRTDSYNRWSIRVTDARLIFLLLHLFSSSPFCFLLLCRNTIAGSCLCPASLTRKLLSRRQPGLCRYWFLEHYLPFPLIPGLSRTPWSLHQAVLLVHNKGSTPREMLTNSTKFRWP